jgi:hypothetical protein
MAVPLSTTPAARPGRVAVAVDGLDDAEGLPPAWEVLVEGPCELGAGRTAVPPGGGAAHAASVHNPAQARATIRALMVLRAAVTVEWVATASP